MFQFSFAAAWDAVYSLQLKKLRRIDRRKKTKKKKIKKKIKKVQMEKKKSP